METKKQDDTNSVPSNQKRNRRQTIKIIIAFAVVVAFSLYCLNDAFEQRDIAKDQQALNQLVQGGLAKYGDSLKGELDKCRKIAEASAIEALKEHQRAEEALKLISKK